MLSIFSEDDAMYVMTQEGKDVYIHDTFDSSGNNCCSNEARLQTYQD